MGHLAMTQSELNQAEDRQQTDLPLHDAQKFLIIKIIKLGVKKNIVSWIVRITSQFQSILIT